MSTSDQQPRISDFWLESPEQRRLRLARKHRQAQIARREARAKRHAAAEKRARRAELETDQSRPLWFMEDDDEVKQVTCESGENV